MGLWLQQRRAHRRALTRNRFIREGRDTVFSYEVAHWVKVEAWKHYHGEE